MRQATIVLMLAILATLVSVPSAQAERPLVAVLEFHQKKGLLSADEIRYLTDLARKAALDAIGHEYDIITEESLEALLKGHGKTLSKCLEGACEVELGRKIGADLVISGRIVRAFGALKLTLKVHRTMPPKLLGASTRSVARNADLEAAVRSGCAELLLPVAGAGPRPAPAPQAQPRPVTPGRPVDWSAIQLDAQGKPLANIAAEWAMTKHRIRRLEDWDDKLEAVDHYLSTTRPEAAEYKAALKVRDDLVANPNTYRGWLGAMWGLAPAGLYLGSVLPATVHWAHGNVLRGFGALIIPTGLVMGGLIASDFEPAPLSVLGIGGALAYIIYDVGWLAEEQPPPLPSYAFVPSVYVDKDDNLFAGFMGRF
jgi:hypothetical protein